MTAPDHTPLDDLRAAVEDLQRERVESRDHRTRVQTLLTLAGAAALLVVAGAVSVRDTVLRQESAVAAITARVVALEVAAGRRETDDRATSAAIVRLQTTLETLQSTIAHRLDAINQRLQTAPHR